MHNSFVQESYNIMFPFGTVRFRKNNSDAIYFGVFVTAFIFTHKMSTTSKMC